MKRKIVWLILSCLMVLALVLASCGPAVPEEEEEVTPLPEEEEEVIPVPEAKYGGVFAFGASTDVLGFDEVYVIPYNPLTLDLTHDELLTGDWAKGRVGSGEVSFDHMAFLPQFEAPSLAESYEIPDPQTVIFHIRKGVHFARTETEAGRLVAGREMTADDVVFSLKRLFEPGTYHTTVARGSFPPESITAPDKWTVVVKVPGNAGMGLPYFTDMAHIVAPELVERYGDVKDWKNSVGTGPFILIDRVHASSMTFVRNPDYWGKDPLYPENSLPYLDKVKMLVIPDLSTRLAAIRAAKIHWINGVLWEDKDSLLKTTPELLVHGAIAPNPQVIWMRVDREPLDDIRVRQALALAIDNQEIKDTYYGGNAELVANWTLTTPEFSDYFVPLEELPQSVREQWEYHPDKARQLLAEAGYPDGFETSIVTYSTPIWIDMLSIVKAYWAEIGVDLEIDAREWGVYNSIFASKAHEQMVYRWNTAYQPWKFATYRPGSGTNCAMVDDPRVNEAYAKSAAANAIGDFAEQARVVKEIYPYIMEQAWNIQVPASYVHTLWWPWVKNYQGEYCIGHYNYYIWTKYIWLDQEVKKEMGY